jgi:hypothetical protein
MKPSSAPCATADREAAYLYPAFPYTAFSRVTDEDMKALYAFLMSEPAVENHTRRR